jgi:predicted nucleotidyltransferase
MQERLERAVRELLSELGNSVVGVALFGSLARGEAGERADADFLVVLRGIEHSLERRRRVYLPLYRGLNRNEAKPMDVTVIDLDDSLLDDPNLLLTPLLLNVGWEGKVLWDPEGRLSRFFQRVRELIGRAGLERYRTPDGKYGWKPKAEFGPAQI